MKYLTSDASRVLLKGRHSRVSSTVALDLWPREETSAAVAFGEASPPVPFEIVGQAGCLIQASASLPRCRLIREIFQAEKGGWTAIRVTVENTSTQPFQLESITPVAAHGTHAITLTDTPFDAWQVLRMARHKNDIPGVFRPSVADADYEDASLDSGEIPAGQGVTDEDAALHSHTSRPIVAEPCMLIQNRHTPTSPGLFIGVLGQTEHLTNLVLTANAAQNALASLDVICEFDRIIVAPGESRQTHWIIFSEESDGNQALAQYAELLATLYACPAPRQPAPSLYCTWYFYGPDFRQADLDENLATLAAEPLPFDIFLLDDGWSDKFGSWQAGPRFPDGMEAAAARIKAAGYKPGIWTCPFVVMADAPVVTEHPELIARNPQGEPYTFPYQGPPCYTVDPTSPYAPAYFNDLFGRLRDWGFEVHKFDFLRAILTTSDIRFHDRTLNRAQAYRLGMTLIRQAMGPDAYLLACGGLFEGSIGIADGMRVGSDTRGYWRQPTYLKTIKQTIMRSYTNRFWHTDPDAAMLRLRSEPFRGMPQPLGGLSLGDFNDEEAFTTVVSQYIGGGMSCISERFAEFSFERASLLRRIIPAGFPVPRIMDISNPGCPELFLSTITPRCRHLKPWWTLAVTNWQQQELVREIELATLGFPDATPLAIFELKEQRFLGVFAPSDRLQLTLPAHGARVLRLTPVNSTQAMILGTDLHLTGGGVELQDVTMTANVVRGRIDSPWKVPVTITAGFPQGTKIQIVTKVVSAAARDFEIQKPD